MVSGWEEGADSRGTGEGWDWEDLQYGTREEVPEMAGRGSLPGSAPSAPLEKCR